MLIVACLIQIIIEVRTAFYFCLLVDKLVECSFTERSSAEECTENIDEIKIANDGECVCSYKICVVLIVVAFSISIRIGAYFVYSCWYLNNDITRVKFGSRIQ